MRDGRAGERRVFNHRWDDPASFATLGTIPAREIEQLTGGRLSRDVTVALNRLPLDYDHVLVCGPVFPHEVVGFSGGTKYLFPGIAGPEIIHFTHWLGALITNYEVIGTQGDAGARGDRPRRARCSTARSRSLAPVVHARGRRGPLLSAPVERGLVGGGRALGAATSSGSSGRSSACSRSCRAMYDDLWVAAKGMYKMEPAVADGGEVVIYAPHVTEVSHVHGRLIDEIGYHCRTTS